ncbi:hypothetical protein B0H10DRAFT_1998230 [Mycena sp. CBHHK59/15]|nr:hypothetical protein B0H10DRAFT_1998230 [Mycena sp. CBHHK59/15]
MSRVQSSGSRKEPSRSPSIQQPDMQRTVEALNALSISESSQNPRSQHNRLRGVSHVERRTGNAESRYLFYRFYSPSGAIVSSNAFDPTDPFLGRIKLTAIAPPRTVDSLKQCLAQSENLHDPTNQRTDLYLTASSDSPIRSSNGSLSVLGLNLGLAPQSALALVLRQDLSEGEKASVGGIHVPDNFRISPGILEGRRRSVSTVNVEPRYIYYRIYTPEKAIPSSSAFHSKDVFIGRMDATRIPPPHTVATLVRCLTENEKLIHQYVNPMLFLTTASQSPMPGSQKIPLLGLGPGFVPGEPLSLVLSTNSGVRSWEQRQESGSVGSSGQYLYYRLYTRGGETASKTSFDRQDKSLGKVDRNHITPPHTAAAIRRCIAKAEENSRYICGVLYPDNSSNTSIPDGVYVALSPGAMGLGMSPRTPVVLVEQERREGVFNRSVQCMVSMDRTSINPGWLACARGEVVLTDGILKPVPCGPGAQNSFMPSSAYTAVGANGMRGYISPGSFRFLDELLPDARRVLRA